MRKITGGQIAIFASIVSAIFVLAGIVARAVSLRAPTDLRGIVLVAGFFLCAELLAILAYRIVLWICPLPEGEAPIGSASERAHHLHVLFTLIFVMPVEVSGLLPIPLRRIFHILLGARIGDNSHGPGIVLDPVFVEIGDNCVLGLNSVLIPHELEGAHVAYHRIRIGNGVTIGAGAKVLPGVTIGDGAVVAVNAVVKKGTTIAPGEVWGGVPARRISAGKSAPDSGPIPGAGPGGYSPGAQHIDGFGIPTASTAHPRS